jgi:hypothetical protein
MTNDSYPAIFRPFDAGSCAMHSGEQNVASPELRFNARSAGTHVPHLAQRTNLLLEGVLGAGVVVAVVSVTALMDSATFRISLR